MNLFSFFVEPLHFVTDMRTKIALVCPLLLLLLIIMILTFLKSNRIARDSIRIIQNIVQHKQNELNLDSHEMFLTL